ncbi:acyltransferase, partial [Pseudomonas aeruginosa]
GEPFWPPGNEDADPCSLIGFYRPLSPKRTHYAFLGD